MNNDFALTLYTPITEGDPPSPIMPISNMAIGWQRSIRLNGGFWDGSFEINEPADVLQEWFNNYLGYHIQETSGGAVTWEGLIYEMVLSVGNFKRRISLSDIVNRSMCIFTDGRTAWGTVQASADRYGTKEETIDQNYSDDEEADNKRDLYLKQYAWPRGVPIEGMNNDPPKLHVSCSGYVHTMNWRHVTIPNGDKRQTVSEHITHIISVDSEFISVGRIDANASTGIVQADIDDESHTPARCWDIIAKDLLPLGDSDANMWRFHIDINRKAYYTPQDVTPTYQVRNGEVFYNSGEAVSLSPWWITPGVFRDLDFPQKGAEEGSLYQDMRDVLIDEIVVDATGGVSYRSLNYGSSQFLDMLNKYIQLKGGGKKKSSVHKSKWMWGDMSKEQQEWWEEGRVGPPPE